MKFRRPLFYVPFAAGVVLAALTALWPRSVTLSYLDGETREFVLLFPPPPAADSAAARRELDELLEMQRTRTPAQVDAARDDRKTEVTRFFRALGLAEDAKLPRVREFIDRAEDDARMYVRSAKDEFRRLRPAEIEPRIDPCIGNVRADLSYPSGHATYAYVTAYLLISLAPERRDALLARAEEFARQRMVCGVHFRSDIEAGRRGAEWLVQRMLASQKFAADSARAEMEMREALDARAK